MVKPRILLLAAGRGRRFGKRTEVLPKCLIPLGNGENLLGRYCNSFRSLGLHDVVIVVGHQKEKIIRECKKAGRGLKIRFIENKKFRLGSIYSLFTASGELDKDCLIMDADVFFETSSLKELISKKRSTFLLDTRSKSAGEEMMLMSKKGRPCFIAKKVDPSLKVVGEATGFFKVVKSDAERLAKILKKMVRAGKIKVEYEDAYNELMKNSVPGYCKIKGFWTEMDFEEDLQKIKNRRK